MAHMTLKTCAFVTAISHTTPRSTALPPGSVTFLLHEWKFLCYKSCSRPIEGGNRCVVARGPVP